jgi:hypothetical protein
MADLKASSSISIEKVSVLDERIGDLALSQIAMRRPHMLLLDENNSIYIHESELGQTVVISTCLIAPRRGGGDLARHRKA